MVLKEDESTEEDFEELETRQKPVDSRWKELEKLKNKLN